VHKGKKLKEQNKITIKIATKMAAKTSGEQSLVPGEPEKTVNGGTTVSGGRTVLSAMAQQSLRTHRRPCNSE